MNTMVTIECSEGDVCNLSVPGGAILRENGRTSIFLYDASSHAIRRCDVTVTRLLSDGRCLITSDGANPGDLVVASGVHHVKRENRWNRFFRLQKPMWEDCYD